MPYCVAPNCKNRSFSKSQKQCEVEVKNKATFHLFPKNIERRRIWLDTIGLTNTSVPKYAYLCSCHFSPESFDRTSAFKVRLKDDAVPNVLCTSIECTPELKLDLKKMCLPAQFFIQKELKLCSYMPIQFEEIVYRNDLSEKLILPKVNRLNVAPENLAHQYGRVLPHVLSPSRIPLGLRSVHKTAGPFEPRKAPAPTHALL